jgi:acetyl-CoA/propionyl-CoA carboxylase
MKDAGVPLVPGSDGVVADLDEAVSIATDCGFPVLLKSAFGGGGRGIRLAKNEKELRQEYEMASTESKAAFGKAALYVEKCLEGIRHIEYQLVRDTHGDSRHLFERECSVQRRHQKLIEMSPSPVLDSKTRNKIGDIAVRAVDAVDYVNAGTAEFLRDNKGNFYFIEINSRLQVEHPVTELVTGLDLVKLQISIAQGEKIPFKQEELILRGAAIECRINAEDPYNEFSPSVGLVPSCNLPYGPGVRVDSYLYPGCTVSGYYDSLIAKLITWGNYFEEARSRMINALNEFEVEGVNTTIPLYKTIMKEEHFIRGELSTDYLERYTLMDKLFKDTAHLSSQFHVPALAALLLYSEFRRTSSFSHGDVRTNTDVPAWIRQREIF